MKAANDDHPPGGPYRRLESALGAAYFLFAGAAAALGIVIGYAGIRELFIGVVGVLPFVESESHSIDLVAVLHGIEYLILAPLAYLVVVAVSGYNYRVRSRQIENPSRARVMSIKALIMGLLITNLAVNLTKTALTSDGLTLEYAAANALVVMVLGFYAIGIEILLRKR